MVWVGWLEEIARVDGTSWLPFVRRPRMPAKFSVRRVVTMVTGWGKGGKPKPQQMLQLLYHSPCSEDGERGRGGMEEIVGVGVAQVGFRSLEGPEWQQSFTSAVSLPWLRDGERRGVWPECQSHNRCCSFFINLLARRMERGAG
ncbi:hypothetical protein CDAR_185241 [Caerostris darwini]|uniref:Uncharacterized protein n=1 Tax=Caerostris darwini TaxID=1538125 RepID=A0AAV4SQF5_9ARAC|nr:hypothetical protein CDAR_185241 [Caerostris darwini]